MEGINLSNLLAKKGGEAAKAASSLSPSVSNVKALNLPIKKDNPPRVVGRVYFHSDKPNLGFFMGGKRYAFKGNYLETDDAVLADYIRQHYGRIVNEITEEQKIDGQTLKG